MMGRWTTATVYALGMMAGCSADLPVADVGEHVTVRSELPWCDETTDWLDESTLAIGAWLGYPPEELPSVTYRRVETSDEAWASCGLTYRAMHSRPGERAGCATGHDVWSNRDADLHELVHALAFPIGVPPPWLQEGLAEILTGEPYEEAPIEPDTELLLSIADIGDFHETPDVEVHYRVAASFVRFLLETLGRDGLLELYASLSSDAGFDDVDDWLRNNDHPSLSAVLDGWQMRGARPWWAIAQPVMGCEAPLLGGSTVTLHPAVSVWVGSRTSMSAVARPPPSPTGWSSLRISPVDCPMGAHARFVGCGNPDPPVYDHVTPPGGRLRMIVPPIGADDFVVINARALDESAPAACNTCDVSIAAEPIETGDCGEIEISLVPGETVQLPGVSHFVHLTWSGSSPLEAWTILSYEEPPEICVLDGACGSRVDCRPAGSEFVPTPLSSPDASLHLAIVPRSDGWWSSFFVAVP